MKYSCHTGGSTKDWIYEKSTTKNSWSGQSTCGNGGNNHCNYEKEIHRLIQELDGYDYSKAIIKRMNYINEMDKLDIYTQFTFCTDQDGKATLKFNTPEEKIRDSIKKIGEYLSWAGGKIGLTVTNEATDAIDKLDKMISLVKNPNIDDNLEKLLSEYHILRKSRDVAMKNLANLADRSLCFGITHNHIKLAELYHEVIPNNESCNSLEKIALLERIERNQPNGFSPFLNKETYNLIKSKCRNISK